LLIDENCFEYSSLLGEEREGERERGGMGEGKRE
jgi:hypothetical protein